MVIKYKMNTEWKERDDFLKLNPYYVITEDIFELSLRDLTGNDTEIIPPLEDGEYIQFIQDLNTAVSKGSLLLSIYTDASGINFALDSNLKSINNRILKTTSYIYPHLDYNGNWVNGIFTCVFDNESTFSIVNLNNSAYWYSFAGVSDPKNLKQFV